MKNAKGKTVERPANFDKWWPCACTQHRKGVLTGIKMHPPTTKVCRVCGCSKPKPEMIAPKSSNAPRDGSTGTDHAEVGTLKGATQHEKEV